MAADTGHGATLTLSEDTTAYAIQSITMGGQSIEMLETTLLSTTDDKTYIPGDLAETPEGSATILFNVGHGLPDPGDTHTITITFPLGPDQTTTTKATFSGTGFITAREYPELVTDQVMSATVSWKMDGETGPTFTAGV